MASKKKTSEEEGIKKKEEKKKWALGLLHAYVHWLFICTTVSDEVRLVFNCCSTVRLVYMYDTFNVCQRVRNVDLSSGELNKNHNCKLKIYY